MGDNVLQGNAISWFNFLRDKMFYVNIKPFGLKMVLQNALLTDKASCVGKHILLGNYFSFLGFNIEYLLFPFRWAELSVDYPKFLKNFADKLPATQHVAINVSNASSVRFIDASWDPPLKQVGFHINSCADKIMENAITPCEEPRKFLNVDTLVESRSKRFTFRSNDENKAFLEFYTRLNEWLDSTRNISKLSN